MTPFYFRGKRTFNLESGQQDVETIEGFFLEEMVDFALGKLPNDDKIQLIVRMKTKKIKIFLNNFLFLTKIKSYESRD